MPKTTPHSSQPPLFLSILRVMVYLAVAFVFYCPILINMVPLVALLGLCLRPVRQGVVALYRQWPVRLGALYFTLVCLGAVLTAAHSSDYVREIRTIALFAVFLPLLIPLFQDEVARKRLKLAMIVSAYCVGFSALLMAAAVVPAGHWRFLQAHTFQQSSVVIAIALYLALHFFGRCSDRSMKVIWGLQAVLLLVLVLGVQQERVGMVLGFVACLLYVTQFHCSVKKIVLFLFLFAAFAGLVYTVSPIMSARVHLAVENVRQAVKGIEGIKAGHRENSLGLRWTKDTEALRAISGSPIFGYGSGSYGPALKNGGPESGFLMVMLRHGLLGLALYCLYWLSWYLVARKRGGKEGGLLFAGMAMLALANCSFPALEHSRLLLWAMLLVIVSVYDVAKKGAK